MPEHKNAGAAILAVMAEVGYVKKERSKGVPYTFASESALIAAVRPAMVDHGLFLAVHEAHIDTGDGPAVVRLGGMFIHPESDTSVPVEAIATVADSQFHPASAASTMAYKYLLRQTFCIETGDDPDARPPERAAQPKPADPIDGWQEEVGAMMRTKGITAEQLGAVVGLSENGSPVVSAWLRKQEGLLVQRVTALADAVEAQAPA